MINRERLLSSFLELVKIDSVSRKEREVALYLKGKLEELGARVFIDDAGEKVGSNTGNIIAKIRGDVPAKPFLVSAHMDTVKPGEGIIPVVEGDIIRSLGETILGADDKAGIAEILEALCVLQEKQIPHGDIEIVFTICEEIGLLGAQYLDYSLLQSRYGLVLDHVGNTLVTKTPASQRIEFIIHGVAAHAAICPERGISAIDVAISGLDRINKKIRDRDGWVDENTLAIVGIFQGGIAANVIPPTATIIVAVRSHNLRKLYSVVNRIRKCFEDAAKKHSKIVDGKELKATVEWSILNTYPNLCIAEDSVVLRHILNAAKRLGDELVLLSTMGAMDANRFAAAGIETVVLGVGAQELHTINEYVSIQSMIKSARIVLETLTCKNSSPCQF